MKRVVAACLLVPALAWADDPTPAPPSTPTSPSAPAPPSTPTTPVAPAPENSAPTEAPAPVAEPVAAAKLDELSADLDVLFAKQKETERLQREVEVLKTKVNDTQWLRRYITVFVDVGAFAVGGDGSGVRTDIGHLYFPKYEDRIAANWVFMGDPLSTAINTNGEPSDTSTSREIPNDTINSQGRPSVIVNTVGLSIGKDIGNGFSVSALAELLPRADDTMFNVELASIDYRRPLGEAELLVSVGKIDSVLGVEYRNQDAPRRLGITPSLICRYTCGRPLGARMRITRGRLSTSATLTNGDNFQRIFEPDLELKSNIAPTATGHLQWMLPVGQGLEVGVSGAYGPQDGQDDTSVRQWHYGFDARLRDFHRFDAVAEYVQGKQPGKTVSMDVECDAAPCITYKGAYLLVDHRITDKLTPYIRADWRSAVHIKGTEFVYESHTFRTTLGAQFELTSQIIGKLEYTFNRELGGIPQFPNDVVTTSIVVKTD